MCGIVGVFDIKQIGEHDLVDTSFKLLKGNKNRGQDGYGLSVVTKTGSISTFKFSDLRSREVRDSIDAIQDTIIGIIGHARYPTSGSKSNEDRYIQPFSVQNRDMGFGFAFNGNIVNAPDLAEEIENGTSMRFERPILDTSILQEMIITQIRSGETNTRRILENINNVIDGQCNIVLMGRDGSFTLAKDRWGFRPVSYHYDEATGLFTFSSESRALFIIGKDESDIQYLNTAEAITFNSQSGELTSGLMNLQVPRQKSRCFFETVYFANSKTKIWGEPSTNHRYRLGQELAKTDSNHFSSEDSVVIDVPASSLYSAQGYAEYLDLAHISGAIIKRPSANRTFIADEQTRQQEIEEKYIFNPELKPLIEGKKLVIIDDSIVRGNTLEYLVEKLKEFYNPSEVHIRIPSPPIIGPCFYAINLKDVDELVVRKYFQDPNNPTLEEFEVLAEHFGADSIKYINKDQLISALRVDVKDMCLACVTGNYPTHGGQSRYDKQVNK